MDDLLKELTCVHAELMGGLNEPRVRQALGDIGCGALKMALTLGAVYLGVKLAQISPGDSGDDADAESDEISAAREVLGVGDNATVDQIRAALRDKLRDSRLHPDQGGDGEAAKRFIDARNLLIECTKAHAEGVS